MDNRTASYTKRSSYTRPAPPPPLFRSLLLWYPRILSISSCMCVCVYAAARLSRSLSNAFGSLSQFHFSPFLFSSPSRTHYRITAFSRFVFSFSFCLLMENFTTILQTSFSSRERKMLIPCSVLVDCLSGFVKWRITIRFSGSAKEGTRREDHPWEKEVLSWTDGRFG